MSAHAAAPAQTEENKGPVCPPIAAPLPRLHFWSAMLLCATGLNCVFQIAWFWRYTSHNVNFDAISYIGIAHHLIDGNFRASLNGYWSPLISWCIAALGVFTHNLLLAGRLVTIASFLACLPLLYLLTSRLWRSATLAAFSVLCFTLARGIVASSVYFIGADFLLTAAVLAYFILLLRCLRHPRLSNWFILGAAHAIAFLAKAFAMPWPMLSTVLAAWLANRSRPSRAVGCMLLAMFLPLLFWSSWGLVLKTKYGHFTAGYQSTWNLLPNQTKVAVGQDGLSFLSDRSRSTDEYLVVDNMYPSSPLWNVHPELGALAPQVFSKERHNLPEAIKQLFILLTPGVILALFLSLRDLIATARRAEKIWASIVLCSAAALVFSYCMLVFDARYLLPLIPLLLALASPFLLPLESRPGYRSVRVIVTALVVLGLFYANLYHASPFRTVRRDYQADVYSLAASLRQLPRCDRLITWGAGSYADHGVSWEAGIYAAYFAHCRLVGFSDRFPRPEDAALAKDDAEALHANSILLIGTAASRNSDALRQALQSNSSFRYVASARDSHGREIGLLLSK